MLSILYTGYLLVEYSMNLTCPECKNDVDFSAYPNLAVGNVIECNVCGITLLVNKMDVNEIVCEVVDEGK